VCVNEGYIYAPSAGTWSPLKYSNSRTLPQPRLVSQAAIIGETLWLIGGWNSNVQGPEAFLGDIWQLDLNSRAWTQVLGLACHTPIVIRSIECLCTRQCIYALINTCTPACCYLAYSMSFETFLHPRCGSVN
jgi:hypothetical protein